MADYDQIMRALRNAHAAGDTAAAQRLAQMAQAAKASAQPLRQAAGTPTEGYNPPPRTIGQTLYENIIGSGAVDTPGERLGELIRGGTAAVARGMADVPAIPANLLQLGTAGVEAAFGMEQPSMVSRGLEALPDTRALLASVPVIGPESQYVAPGTAGEYISTGGEFAGGAGLFSGPRAMLRYGLLPGVASEAAGQATEGTALEPFARTAAAVLAPVGVNLLETGVRRAVSPMGGEISAERQAAVDLLRSEGVRPTAGQVVGGRAAEGQLYRETATAAGRELAEQADADFTSAVMQRVGAPAGAKATADELIAAEDRLSGVYRNVLGSTDIAPQSGDLAGLSSVLQTYRDLAPATSAPGLFERVNEAVVNAFRANKTIPGETLYSWRKQFSKLTKSQDEAIRTAAIEATDVLDDMIENTLNAAGRADDYALFADARNKFRNLFAVEKAAERAGVEGIISPLALRTALLQQGRRRYVQGKGDLGPITAAAADILKPLPQSGTQPRLSVRDFAPGAAAGTGAGLFSTALGASPELAAAVGIGTAVGPTVRNWLLTTPAGQAYMSNQLVGRPGPLLDQRMLGLTPGLLAQ